MNDHPGNNLFEFLKLMRQGDWRAPGSIGLKSIKAFIHGYFQGLFQNNIKENSFPKYRWFSAWLNGRIDQEYNVDNDWTLSISKESGYDEEKALEFFLKYYEEFINSKVECSFQSLTPEKKGLRNKNSGYTWDNIQDLTSELLLFELPPSKTAWCLFLTEKKSIYLTIDDLSREVLIEKIKKDYFTINEDWTHFDGTFFLKNLILKPVNNY